MTQQRQCAYEKVLPQFDPLLSNLHKFLQDFTRRYPLSPFINVAKTHLVSLQEILNQLNQADHAD